MKSTDEMLFTLSALVLRPARRKSVKMRIVITSLSAMRGAMNSGSL